MSAEHCFHCNYKAKEKDKYCTNCGAPLTNRCTNDGGPFGDPCKKVNEKSAVFCAECGSYTTFYKAGMLNTLYSDNKRFETNDLNDFMHFDHHFFK